MTDLENIQRFVKEKGYQSYLDTEASTEVDILCLSWKTNPEILDLIQVKFSKDGEIRGLGYSEEERQAMLTSVDNAKSVISRYMNTKDY